MDQILIVQTVAPLLVAIFLFVGLRLLLGATGMKDRLQLASIAIPVGFIVGFVLIVGWPPFPPIAVQQKILWVALAGLLAGAVMDILAGKLPGWATVSICLAWPAIIVLWVGWPFLERLDFSEFEKNPLALGPTAGAAGIWLAGSIGLLQLRRTRADKPNDLAAGIMLAVASVGAGALAIYFDTGSTGQIAFALAAATAGVVLVNYATLIAKPALTARLGWAAILGGGGALVALVLALGMTTTTSFWALSFLVPVFFADMFWNGRPKRDHAVARILRPILVTVTAMIPAMVLVYVVVIIRQLTGE